MEGVYGSSSPSVTLLVIPFAMNAGAILLCHRFQRRRS
jgi:hypothetical protein